MKLTPEQKESLLYQYNDSIWNTVWHFKRRSTSGFADPRDLYQEAVLAFFTYIDKWNPEEKPFVYPYYTILKAMTMYTLGLFPVSFPKRTNGYKSRIANSPKGIGGAVDWVDEQNYSAVDPIGDSIDKVCFDAFVGTLPEKSKQAIEMKKKGVKNIEIAKAMDESPVKITRILQDAKNRYHKYLN